MKLKGGDLKYEGKVKILNSNTNRIKLETKNQYTYYRFSAISHNFENEQNTIDRLENLTKLTFNNTIFANMTCDEGLGELIAVAQKTRENDKLFMHENILTNITGLVNIASYIKDNKNKRTVLNHKVKSFSSPKLISYDTKFYLNENSFEIVEFISDEYSICANSKNKVKIAIPTLKRIKKDSEEVPKVLKFGNVELKRLATLPYDNFDGKEYIYYSGTLKPYAKVECPDIESILNPENEYDIYYYTCFCSADSQEYLFSKELIHFVSLKPLELGNNINIEDLISIPGIYNDRLHRREFLINKDDFIKLTGCYPVEKDRDVVKVNKKDVEILLGKQDE